LYQVVQRELRTLVQMCEEKNRPLPTFVVQEFEKFLRCGILAHGFARVRCCDCGHDRLVGFSCKRRGFCPSCYGKWMAEKSAHLVDRVFDQIPVRQWVLALPIPFRFLLAYNGSLQSAVLKCFIDSVSRYLRHKAKREYNLTSVKEAHPAFVTGIHRSDSSAKLNLHFHTLCPDGVFIEDYHKGPMSFAEVSPPTHKEIEAVAIETCHRTIRMLTKRGLWLDGDFLQDNIPDTDPALASFAAASIQGRLLLGSNAGGQEMRVRGAAARDDVHQDPNASRGYDFNLHAKRRVEADDPEGLEKLCRYILRPPIANSRLTWMGNDKVALTLKRPWSDGTTQLVFTPLEFVQRLIPLIPMPGTNRLRFHGAFAPNSPYRSRVVPRPCSDEAPSRDHVQTDVGEAGASNKGGHKADEHQSTSPSAHSDCRHQSPASKSKSLGWAKCMARVFDLDVLTCPKCKGDMQILSFITDTPVIKKILNSVGLSTAPPTAHPAKGQMRFEYDYDAA